MEPTERLKTVGTLAKQALTQNQIAKELGYANTVPLSNWLVKVSQATGKPVPAFGGRSRAKAVKRVETAEVKSRGKGRRAAWTLPGTRSGGLQWNPEWEKPIRHRSAAWRVLLQRV